MKGTGAVTGDPLTAVRKTAKFLQAVGFLLLIDTSVGNSVSDDHLVHHLRELDARRRELEAETASVLAELDAREAYRADGHATMWGLLRVTGGWSDRECRERMRIARLTAAHPDAMELLAETQASVANIAEIARGFCEPSLR